MPITVAAFGRTIADAFRLAFFLPLKDGRPAASWAAIFFLLVVSIGWPTMLAFPGVGLAGTFSIQALGDAMFHVPLLFLAAIAAAHAVDRKEEVPRIFAAGLLISILVDWGQIPGAILAVTFTRTAEWVVWAFPAWLILALGIFAARQGERGLQRLGALAFCFIFLVPLTFTFRDRVIWQTALDPDLLTTRTQYGSAGSEDVFYRQPKLLAQALEAIRPGSAGVIDVFFIAMGGYADQDVFRREVDATTRLMAERFGAEGHSIRLINNHDTLHDLPIASRTSLRAALNRVASVMDKEEDVLVLFLTSHGSQKHVFTLQLWPLRFEDVDPPTVRALLDEAGIRNRVVIVSACYSGGFTKPLEDANTLVITAAAADKTSFGCSNEAEWTYFGKAYFDEALRTTHSFTKAFEIAKPLIREREAKVHAEISDPQMSIGPEIAIRLAALERQLEGHGDPAAAARPSAAASTAAKDKYVEYVDILFQAEFLEELAKTCRQTMAQRSPEAMVRKRSDAFWGAHRSPQHWKRITQAWDTYSESFCAGANDKALLRDTYLQKTRAVMREGEVDAALAFLRTDAGARWYRAEQEVIRQQTLEMTRMQGDLEDRLLKAYREAETAALEAFQKSGK